MGAGLVKSAIEVADRTGLDHGPARLFFGMALAALDNADRPIYFAGQDALARVLGVPRNENGYRAVRRAITACTAAGALAVAAKGAPGRPSRYWLLDGQGAPLAVRTPDAERPVNKSEHRTLSAGTPDAQWSEHRTLNVRQRSREEEQEEGTRRSAPTRTCTRHADWQHNEPCRRCGDDRRAFELHDFDRRPATMSEPASPCVKGHRFDQSSGYCGHCGLREDAA